MRFVLLCFIMSIIISDYIYASEAFNVAVLTFKGSLGSENIPAIVSAINNYISEGEVNIILDFSSLDCVEKDVWFSLVELKSYIISLGGNIFISNMSGFVKHEFSLLGLSSCFSQVTGFEEIAKSE